MPKRIYVVTGAAGHLGSTIVRALLDRGDEVRALVVEGERNLAAIEGAQIVRGDVCDIDSLRPLFNRPPSNEMYIIHCAGIVTIASAHRERIRKVNVEGTRNIVKLCVEYGVDKLVYISSVHAIPERPMGEIIREVNSFSADDVVGLYAKTKAEATQIVLNAAERGLNVSVAHPSGLCGPNDRGRGHITQLFKDYYSGHLTALVNGGYDFSDVRDVAQGILSCAEKGGKGECYILSGKYYTIPQVVQRFADALGRKPIKTILPMWFAKLTSPLAELYYMLRRQPPLYTPYSLYTITSNALFSHEKATRELGYRCRPLETTVSDMARWMIAEGLV